MVSHQDSRNVVFSELKQDEVGLALWPDSDSGSCLNASGDERVSVLWESAHSLICALGPSDSHSLGGGLAHTSNRHLQLPRLLEGPHLWRIIKVYLCQN